MGCVCSTEEYDPIIVCSNIVEEGACEEIIVGSLVLPKDKIMKKEYTFHIVGNGGNGWYIVACMSNCDYHFKVTDQIYVKEKHAIKYREKILNGLKYIK